MKNVRERERVRLDSRSNILYSKMGKQWKNRRNSHEKLRSLRPRAKVAHQISFLSHDKKMEYLGLTRLEANKSSSAIERVAATAASLSLLYRKKPRIPRNLKRRDNSLPRKKRGRRLRLSWHLYIAEASRKGARSQQRGRKLIGDAPKL